MWEPALKIASQVTHPISAAMVALVISAYLFWHVFRAKRPRNAWILGVLAAAIIILGIAPIASSTYLQARDVYRVRTVVLGPDHSPVEDAEVTCSIGGEGKRVQGGWEFDVPPQTRPADGRLILYASQKSAFLTGTSSVILGKDYYLTTTVQLTHDTSAMIRGMVVDEHRRPISGATVSIPGYPDVVTTDKAGNFALSAHVADGQIVEVRVLKGQLVGNISTPAGRLPVEILVKKE